MFKIVRFLSMLCDKFGESVLTGTENVVVSVYRYCNLQFIVC